jgi:hypothetical protein
MPIQYFSAWCIVRILNGLHKKYDNILHFYFARNIRSYIRKRANNQDCVLYNDFQFYDCDNEFLKRVYRTHEVFDRIKLLAGKVSRYRSLL